MIPLPDVLEEVNAAQAIHSVKEGSFGKASQVLSADGAHRPTEGIHAVLLLKHPRSVTETDSPLPFPVDGRPTPNFQLFTEGDVLQGIRSFPRRSDPGTSDLLPSQLRHIVDFPTENPFQ